MLAVNGEELGGKFLAQALPPGQPAYVFTVERGGGGSTAALEATVFELLDSDELLSTSAPALATLDVSRPAAVKLAKAAANLEEAGGALDRADDEMMSFWKLVFTNDADFLKAGGASGLGSLPDCYLAAHWLCNCTCESLTGTRARANKNSHSTPLARTITGSASRTRLPAGRRCESTHIHELAVACVRDRVWWWCVCARACFEA